MLRMGDNKNIDRQFNLYFLVQFFLIAFSSLAFSQTSSSWGNAQFSTTLIREWSYDLEQDKLNLWQLSLHPYIEIPVTQRTDFTALLRGKITAIDDFRNEAPDQAEVAGKSRFWDLGSGGELELRELHYRIRHRNGYSTVGKQEIVWGVADGIKVLDVVNPQSYKTFILEDPNQSRIPLWMLNTELLFEQWGFQMLFIPDNSYHDFPEQGLPFAYSSPLLIPSAPTGASVIVENGKRPNGLDLGWRVSTFVFGWDLTVNYLSHYDDTPVIRRFIDLDGVTPVVTVVPEYARTQLIGSSVSNAFGTFSLRLETALQIDKFFIVDDPTDSDGVESTDEWAYVLGLDYSSRASQLLGIQLHQSILTETSPEWVRDNTETHLTFNMQQRFWHDRVTLDGRLIYNLNRKDGLFQSQGRLEVLDNLFIWIGLDLFFGDELGIFGQFDQQDRIVSGIEIGIN